MTGPEIASIVKDCLLAGAASATVAIGYLGLSTWNRQLRGQADFEAARQVAHATYKLRDEIRGVRSRLVRAYEFPEGYFAKTRSTRSDAEEADALAHVYANRWRPVVDAHQEFQVRALEAEALWGKRIRDAADELTMALGELRTSIDAVIDNARSGGADFKTDPAWAQKMRANVGASSADQDTLSLRFEAAIRGIEGQVRPHLRRSY